jgi:hypothetical protein
MLIPSISHAVLTIGVGERDTVNSKECRACHTDAVEARELKAGAGAVRFEASKFKTVCAGVIAVVEGAAIVLAVGASGVFVGRTGCGGEERCGNGEYGGELHREGKYGRGSMGLGDLLLFTRWSAPDISTYLCNGHGFPVAIAQSWLIHGPREQPQP